MIIRRDPLISDRYLLFLELILRLALAGLLGAARCLARPVSMVGFMLNSRLQQEIIIITGQSRVKVSSTFRETQFREGVYWQIILA